ncbi:cysteine desulfurase family protein [Dubosiella newyorkensis]|uniref:Cysteine desulfurase n=3 Tax=Dubosiella newyorkensis TaxID=1862672 RepID=A0A1U7NL30_9FIRM|nr:cysteine desulfurase family protein [Dubosiella newyorkensis]OLU45303.1 cysteine desulfurase [Dubosiella newyorkensis]
MIYFDHASTTSPHPEVVRVYTKLLNASFANADSLHAPGRKVKQQMERSREKIAQMLHVKNDEIFFTSCASESNSLAIVGFALANQNRGKHILTSNVEHSSTKHAFDFLESVGFEIERLPIHEDGTIWPEDIQTHLKENTILVSIMHVNNEIGSINDIERFASIVHEHPFCQIHSDCVQSFGKVDVPFEKLDMATISAHKIHGLKGSALLVKKENVRLKPIVFGGQQEQGLRGGTENAPANIALAKTIRLALEEQEEAYYTAKEINSFLRKEVEFLGGHILSPANALPYILNISFDAITSEVLQNALDQKGICVSGKSTCDSKSKAESEVVLALGKSHKEAKHAIRLSFGKDNTMQEAKEFIQAIEEILKNYGLSI